MIIKDRIDLAKYFAEKKFLYGAEVGVADGRYSEILCKTIPDLHLYSIDPYIPYDGNWRSAEYQQKAHEQAEERLSTYNARILATTSLEASLGIMDESLDFVFIDGAHDFDNVMLDIILWSKKVRPGGIVALHDYYMFKSGGVISAVNAYVEQHNIDLNLTLRGVAEHKDDKCPCAWWVKK